MSTAERKGRLRAALSERRAGVASAEAREAARAVAERLAACDEFAAARRVALYASLPDELPTGPLLDAVRAARKTELWPRFDAGRPLEFAACAREELVPGRHGVSVPQASLPASALGRGDLVIVPCVAFDAAGRRLGRGGGYYDRTFPPGAEDGAVLAGVGYGFQLLEEVPAERHDRRLDLMVTDRTVLRSARHAELVSAAAPDPT